MSNMQVVVSSCQPAFKSQVSKFVTRSFTKLIVRIAFNLQYHGVVMSVERDIA
jgi:hypothetical protein